MTVQSVRMAETKHGIHIRGIDVLSFFVLAATINVYLIDLYLPTYLKSAIAMIGLFFICIYHLSMRKPVDNCAIIWGIYMIWLCACNFHNSRNLVVSLFYPAKIIVFILINKLYIDRQDKTLLKLTRHYMTFLIVVTFLLQMMDQDMFGYTNAHNYLNLFVSDNYLGWYYVSYIALCVMLDFIEQDRVLPITYFEIGLCTASIVRAWVGKTIIGMALIVLYLLFVYRKGIARFFIPKFLGIGYVVLNIGIVFFGMQRLVASSLYDFLGKNITLSGRTTIWLSAIRNISKSPVYGHGITKGGELFINRALNGELMPAHNIFLEIAVQTGIVGLALYIIMLIVAFSTGHQRYLRDHRCQRYRYEYLFLTFIVFIMFSMAILSHPVYIPFFYLPLILLTSFDSLVDMRIKNVNQIRK